MGAITGLLLIAVILGFIGTWVIPKLLGYSPGFWFLIPAGLLMSFPVLIEKILDPIAIRMIKEQCEKLGLENVKIESWPSSFGVRYGKKGKRKYAKCNVSLWPEKPGVHWEGDAPKAE